MAGGVWTNSGNFIVRQITSGRFSRFLQQNGLFVSTGTNGVHLHGFGTTNVVVTYSVIGGTNIVEGYVLGETNDTLGTVNFTNSAKLVVGSLGITLGAPSLSTVNINLNSGGSFSAKADWTNNTVGMKLGSGTFVFNAADLDGTPHNITINGVLSSSGSLNKTGNGILTLGAINTYSGTTLVNGGTLALAAGASLASTPVTVSAGATFDVSAEGGYALASGKTLAGFGTIVGDVLPAAAAIINPGTNTAPGTLTFANGLNEQGGVINHLDLSTNPTVPATT